MVAPAVVRATIVALAAAALAGCSSMPSWSPSSWMPDLGSLPGMDWLVGRGKSNKPGPLPELAASASAQVLWQSSVGKPVPGIAPAVVGDAVYAADADGNLVRLEGATGRQLWRVAAGTRIGAGPGSDGKLVVVGTTKGEVLAFTADGKPAWTAKVSSEVLSPPAIADDVVVVVSGDGRIYGLGADDGKTRWVEQRQLPPLTVRNPAGAVASRGGVFIGTPGGRLLALDARSGAIGWEGAVALPKGATELERIADVTSRPLVEERQACAVAFQGRVACFEIVRGTLNWSREFGSLTGLAADDKSIYVADDKGAIHALDRTTGATVWKQDRLAERRLGGVQLIGEFVGTIDVEGYLHLVARVNGAYVGRLATDGSPAIAQPVARGDAMIWHSANGTVYAATAR